LGGLYLGLRIEVDGFVLISLALVGTEATFICFLDS
jgi:hypothetical protein